ncbi:hypothetical protein [Arthrobacter sp. NPDC090010]|uniref:hypothetical protein n=1 Tax=Arthrobacter sp. NPDC090010 TaxID=3363942 RepID=UPI00381EA740
MKSIKKRFAALLSTFLIAAGLIVAMPAASNAATSSSSCSGSYVSTKYVKNGSGTVIGRVGVYREGNYMCAILIKAGPAYGVRTYVKLDIQSRDGGFRWDFGDFLYRTDALRIYAPDHTIYFNAHVEGKNGGNFYAEGYVRG